MIRIFNEGIKLPECQKCHGKEYKLDPHGHVIEVEGVPQRCECYYFNLLLDANIGFDYWAVEPKNFQGEAKDLAKIQNLLDDISALKANGAGAYIYGPDYGTGKTTLAVMILKAAIREGYGALFTPFADLVILNTKLMNGSFDKTVETKIDYIKNVDFLVLDDLAKEFDTFKDNGRATLNSILRYRDLYRNPTIYTSNVPITDIASLYGGSNYSIIYGRSQLITMENSEDYRKTRKIKHQRASRTKE